MPKLAIAGGEPVRKKRFDPWPVYTEAERCSEGCRFSCAELKA
jgi:hypothetical protein